MDLYAHKAWTLSIFSVGRPDESDGRPGLVFLGISSSLHLPPYIHTQSLLIPSGGGDTKRPWHIPYFPSFFHSSPPPDCF